MKRLLIASVLFIALVAIWQTLVAAQIWSPVLLPPPADVGRYLLHALGDGTLVEAAWVTTKRLLIGYLIGCPMGLPLGLMTARSVYLSDTIGVLALGLQTLPSVCWVPLALLWFGQTEAAMLFVVVMGTLWSVLIAIDGRRAQPAAALCPCRAHDGQSRTAHTGESHPARVAAIRRQRHEAGLGLRLALAHGG